MPQYINLIADILLKNSLPQSSKPSSKYITKHEYPFVLKWYKRNIIVIIIIQLFVIIVVIVPVVPVIFLPAVAVIVAIFVLFPLNLLFFSNTDSPFYVITMPAVFTVQLNGTGRAEICMTLPDLADEDLDL